MAKRAHAFKGFASSYNVEIFYYFDPELQFKDIGSTSKSKLINLLSKSRGFKSVTTLVLVFKKIETEKKTKYDIFLSQLKSRKSYQWK